MDLNTKFEEPGVTIPNFTTTSPWPIPNDNTSSMIIPTFLLLAICFVGVIGNFCIAWVTFRGKEFRSTCYTFIAFNAITSIIMELWNISYVHYAIKATYYTVWDCWYIGIVPAFCMNASIMLTVVTSGDRLFSIMAPSVYCSLSKLRYLTLIIGIPLATSGYWAFLSYFPMKGQANRPVLCVFQNYIQGYVASGRTFVFFAASVILLLAHVYLWRLMKTKHSISGTTKKIVKALTTNCIILAIQFSVYLIFELLLPIIPTEIQLSLSIYVQCFLHLGFASNFFVYYKLSQPYTKAFGDFLPCLKTRSNDIVPLSLVSQSNKDTNLTQAQTLTSHLPAVTMTSGDQNNTMK